VVARPGTRLLQQILDYPRHRRCSILTTQKHIFASSASSVTCTNFSRSRRPREESTCIAPAVTGRASMPRPCPQSSGAICQAEVAVFQVVATDRQRLARTGQTVAQGRMTRYSTQRCIRVRTEGAEGLGRRGRFLGHDDNRASSERCENSGMRQSEGKLPSVNGVGLMRAFIMK
jgi:hypothetical protein